MIELPVSTRRLGDPSPDDFPNDAVFAFAADELESRTNSRVWERMLKHGRNCFVIEHLFEDSIRIRTDGASKELSLVDDDAIMGIFGGKLYLDISGMPLPIWASIIRAFFRANHPVDVVYTEPATYRMARSSDSIHYDLSTMELAVAPLPGFAFLQPVRTSSVFVAMLGFEGHRPTHIAAQLEPPKTIPIVGAPGFRPEYPHHAILCNGPFLAEYDANVHLRLARASCPFDSLDQLEKIASEFPDSFIQVAPVGTKPHALGAILFALRNPERVEIYFDNPVRKPGATSGHRLTHIYRIDRSRIRP